MSKYVRADTRILPKFNLHYKEYPINYNDNNNDDNKLGVFFRVKLERS